MPRLRRLAVFLASSPGTDPAWARLAYDTGRALADRDIGLVYGGGGLGLIGDLAQGALDAGGEVIGVIPRDMLTREWGRDDLTELHVVGGMHERKALMAQHADAFLVLPGGLGTLEEIFEVWTWRVIGYHDKPVGFLDAGGFWAPLLAAIRGIGDAGFLRQTAIEDLVVASTLDEALAGLEAKLPSERELRPGT